MSKLPYILVTGKDELDTLMGSTANGLSLAREMRERYKWLISIGGPTDEFPEVWERFGENHRLRLDFDDCERESATRFGYKLVSEEEMDSVVLFGRSAMGPGIVHCAQGMSRSPAVAYIVLCAHLGPGREKQAAQMLYDDLVNGSDSNLRAPVWRPNRRVIELGFRALAKTPLGQMARVDVYRGRAKRAKTEFYALFKNRYVDTFSLDGREEWEESE